MKFSVWPSYERTWDETLELARWAEANGMESFWFADHFMPNTDDGAPDPGEALECWTTLTAIGALVPRVRLVSMVSPVTIHHPVVLTKRAITADHVSGGRVVLGLGAGWQVNEHAAYGFELPEPGPRVTRFEEAIQVVRSLRDQASTTFSGQHYMLADAPCSPKPVGRMPILVGTGSPRMSRITARYADEWNTWGDPAEVARRTAQFDAACEAVGRDPGAVHRSAQALVFLRDPGDLAPAGRSLRGSDQALVDQLSEYAAMGVHEFAIPDFTLGRTHAQRMDAYAHLAANVLPHVA